MDDASSQLWNSVESVTGQRGGEGWGVETCWEKRSSQVICIKFGARETKNHGERKKMEGRGTFYTGGEHRSTTE